MKPEPRAIALAAGVFGAILAASACGADEDASPGVGTGGGANGTEGGAKIACDGPAECGSEYQNTYAGYIPCRDGYCAPCTADAECDGNYCQEGRCVDCLIDAHCPANKPWCYHVTEGTRKVCWECTMQHECAKGYCFSGALTPGGGECLAGNCATDPSGNPCLSCLAARASSTNACPGCAAVSAAYSACAYSACAPACCSTERAAALSCLKSCMGDECD